MRHTQMHYLLEDAFWDAPNELKATDKKKRSKERSSDKQTDIMSTHTQTQQRTQHEREEPQNYTTEMSN